MKLLDLYKSWEKNSDSSMTLLDKDGRPYNLTSISNTDLWNMQVISFYFNNNNLTVIVS